MAKHQDLGAEKAHVPGFFQETDPGAVGAGKLWIDTSGGTGNWVIKLRNEADDDWEAVSGNSGYTDHGALLGLGDDDHPQYLTEAEADALYEPLGGGGASIPHYNVGVGRLQMIATNATVANAATGSGGESVRFRASDFIRSFEGGGASPQIYIDGSMLAPLTYTITGNGGTDPASVYIDFTVSAEWPGGTIAVIRLKADDGSQAAYVECALNLQDSDVIGGW